MTKTAQAKNLNDMDAKEYFKKEYGSIHIKDVVNMNDFDSLYSLIDEYHQAKSKEEAEERHEEALDHMRVNFSITDTNYIIEALRIASGLNN